MIFIDLQKWRNIQKIRKVLRRKLREPLKIGEKVLALAERVKKKDAPHNLFKSTTENTSFFDREQLFIVRKIIQIADMNYYWISKEAEDKIINKRLLRQELYAINDQFY